MTTTDPSPFDALEGAFRALSSDPRPLVFDGGAVPDLPERAIPLRELQAILLRPATSFPTRNAVVSVLVERAKSDGGAATIALCGVLLPGLRRAAHSLVRTCPERAADIEADMLAGLLSTLARVSPRRACLASYLVGMAFAAGRRGVHKELAEQGRLCHDPHAAPPMPPFGHPDFVLYGAALEGVISADDAELIGSTRLEGVSLKRAAYARGIDYKTAAKRRDRAEDRLLAYLRDEWPPAAPTDAEETHDEDSAAGSARTGTSRFVECRDVENGDFPITFFSAARPYGSGGPTGGRSNATTSDRPNPRR